MNGYYYYDENSISQSTSNDDEILNNLNLETLDILNSNDFKMTLKSIIDSLSNELLEKSLTKAIVQRKTTLLLSNHQQQQMLDQSLPFAKLIPIFNQLKGTNQIEDIKVTTIFYSLLFHN
jgi:hypothetical protein